MTKEQLIDCKQYIDVKIQSEIGDEHSYRSPPKQQHRHDAQLNPLLTVAFSESVTVGGFTASTLTASFADDSGSLLLLAFPIGIKLCTGECSMIPSLSVISANISITSIVPNQIA